MPVFEYTALNASGKKTRGVIDADTTRTARQRLREMGVFPTSLEESTASSQPRATEDVLASLKSRRVNTTTLAIATRQLSTLVGSGMPLVEALRALSDLVDHPGLKKVIAEVGGKVNEGLDLATAMRSHPRVFSRLYTNMIAAGQANGRLDVVLERLSDLLEGQAALQRRIKAAMTYPILMVGLCFVVIAILLAYVVPQITEIFMEQGQILPLPTRIVVAVSDFFQSYWWAIFGLIGLMIFGVKQYGKTVRGRYVLDRLKLKAPIFGPLQLKVATSRFARNLGTLLASDVPILEALRIVRNILGNVLLEDAVEKAAEGVREGRSFSRELAKAEIFPRMLIHMVGAGEQSGERLSQMLVKAASSYESEVDTTVSSLTSVLEPFLIIFLAMVVGCILAAVMLPMLELNALGAR